MFNSAGCQRTVYYYLVSAVSLGNYLLLTSNRSRIFFFAYEYKHHRTAAVAWTEANRERFIHTAQKDRIVTEERKEKHLCRII